MATLSITIPDAIAARVRDSYCAATGYQDQLPNPAFDPMQPEGPENLAFIPNPISKMAWVKMEIIAHIRQQILAAEMGAYDAQQGQDRVAHTNTITSALTLT